MISLQEMFSRDGPLAEARGGLEPRAGQLAMAQAIERGFLESLHTLVEAGTGTGKSLGYLIPALRSGKRVVISTGTVALQERLLELDIPLAARATRIDPRVVLLKGRNHYLCRDKFLRTSSGSLLAPTPTLDAIWAWALDTQSGDRAELGFLPPAQEWESLDADADDCVGELCGEFGRCHYFRARAAAREADIVIVNHALFCLDLAHGGILPPYDVVIFDEAHQLEHWMTQALTGELSERTVGRRLRRLQRAYTVPAAHEAQAVHALRVLQNAILSTPGERFGLQWEHNDQTTIDMQRLLSDLRAAWQHLAQWLESEGPAHRRAVRANEEETLRRLEMHLREVRALVATIDAALRPRDESVAWVERADGAGSVRVAPYDVAPVLRERLFSRTESVVLTSATLAERGSFAFLRRTLGIDQAQEIVVESPFSYERQTRLFLAPAQLNPKSMHFVQRAVPLIEEALHYTAGRAFILCTSLARMREMHALLAPRLPYPTRIQGTQSPASLLAWFRVTANAVLFASGAFWEGIDVAGEALSCVIIDRLPFPSPSDPLVAARIASLEARGRDGFENYMVPAAAARLKQGFGRLIRARNDRGALVLLDGRAGSTGFGRAIITALPPATRIRELSELRGFFSAE